MIKRTLFFGNPYFLSTRLEQLIITDKEKGVEKSAPIEDLGFLVLDHPQIIITQPALDHLISNNVAVIFCNQKHLPASMLLPLDAHYVQNERFRQQLEASLPMKKQLWQQTIERKIENQALLLDKTGNNPVPLRRWAKEVKSGDSTNREGLAAKYYWGKLFNAQIDDFERDRFGFPPNNLLNYGYAVLRAATARALAGTGLLSTFGIHHRNRYNAFTLADDIMEPYRPFIDSIVYQIVKEEETIPEELNQRHKITMLQVFTMDSFSDESTSPLMISLLKTTQSLAQCYAGEKRKLFYPDLDDL